MKFVAKTSIHNAPELGLKLDAKTPNFSHPLQIPKGHRFEIAPDAKSLKGVSKQDEKQLISKLVMFDLVVVDDGSPESSDAIKTIDTDVKNEIETSAVNEKKRQASAPLTMEKLLTVLAENGLIKKAA